MKIYYNSIKFNPVSDFFIKNKDPEKQKTLKYRKYAMKYARKKLFLKFH